jgi:atypical dual specificity phosphatase
MTDSAPALRLSGFGVCFGRRVVLSGVDLVLPAKGVDVLIGPTRSGKSTLMRSLAGLNDATSLHQTSGQAELAGRAIAPDWRPALVQQNAASLSAKLRDALVMHARPLNHRPAQSWTDMAEATLNDHGLGHLRQQLDQPVLSLPPRCQRAVCILSYALTGPALLMLDEPTSGLDESDAVQLLDWLAELGRKHKLLLTLRHQHQVRQLADSVILLADRQALVHETGDRFFDSTTNPQIEEFGRTGHWRTDAENGSLPERRAEVVQAIWQPEAIPAGLEASQTASAQLAPARVPARPVIAQDEPPWWENTVPISFDDLASPVRVARQTPSSSPSSSATSPRSGGPTTETPPTAGAAVPGPAHRTGARAPAGFNWIIANKLAGCAGPGVMSPIDYDLNLLSSVGITDLITLTESDLPQDALQPHGLRNLHSPINDHEAPDSEQAAMLVLRMGELLAAGCVVAVHCKAGIGRTGTILAAWLISTGLSADQAIQRLRAIMPTYVQSAVQEQFLSEFEIALAQAT